MAPLPWVEKYRPKCVADISHQPEVVDSLSNAIASKNLPHLIFYGPPGTGKTSTILAAARQLFGEEYKSRVMELNASDERGIGIVRNKIKSFAQVAVSSRPDVGEGGGIPPYKLIVLDEADSMTTDAQSALRRTMETYSKVTRFCIICNYISRIIPPIASRCAKFRFKPLPHSAMVGRLQFIASEEGVDCPHDALSELMKQSEGDMRRAIQMLQSLHQLHGGTLAPQAVLDISGALPAAKVDEIVAVVTSADFDRMTCLVEDLICEGFPTAQIVSQLLEKITQPDVSLSNNQRSKFAIQLAEVDKMLTDGADDHLQLLNLFAFMMRIKG